MSIPSKALFSPAPHTESHLVDAVGHPVDEGALPDGTPVWIHGGAPVRGCPAVLTLLDLRRLSPEDDFCLPWEERWCELAFEEGV